MNYVKQFFSYDFQFYVNPVRLDTVDQVFAGISAALIIAAIVCKLTERYGKNSITNKLVRRLANVFGTVGILGVLWYGARYQNVNVLGSHFMFFVIACVGLVWFAYIATYCWKQYRPEKLAWEKEQVKQKYLK